MYPPRIEPQPGQESVWDYPRPPRLEPSTEHIQIVFNHEVIVDSRRTWRILETTHPPTYVIPPDDVNMTYLVRSNRQTFCEFKGIATYYTVKVGSRHAENAVWSYAKPSDPRYEPVSGYLGFYAGPMDRCTVNGEVVKPQDGNLYSGWITSNVVGPFKGGPGTWGW